MGWGKGGVGDEGKAKRGKEDELKGENREMIIREV